MAKKKRVSLTQQESELLKSLLDSPEDVDLKDVRTSLSGPGVAQAFVEKLPSDDPDTIPFLVAVRDAFPEKAVQKAVRRKAFLLGQRGLHVPEPSDASPEEGILRSVAGQDRPFAHATSYDVLGMRTVLYGIPRQPRGFELGVGFLNHETGIQQFASVHVSKKKAMAALSEFVDDFQESVDISPAHAVSLLEQGYQSVKNSPGASSYLSARPWLMNQVTLPKTHPVYDLVPEDEISGQPLSKAQAQRLFENELLSVWILDPAELNQTAREIQEVLDSPLHLSDEQVGNRILEIRQKKIEEYFTDEKRRAVKARLEETAFLLHRLGSVENARLALTAAVSLDQNETLLQTNAFLDELMERTLDLILEEHGGGDDEDSFDTEPEDGNGSPSGLILP